MLKSYSWSLDAAEGDPASVWPNFVFKGDTLKSCVFFSGLIDYQKFCIDQLVWGESLSCTMKRAHCAEKAYSKNVNYDKDSLGVKLLDNTGFLLRSSFFFSILF